MKCITNLEQGPLPKIMVCFLNINMQEFMGTYNNLHSQHRNKSLFTWKYSGNWNIIFCQHNWQADS